MYNTIEVIYGVTFKIQESTYIRNSKHIHYTHYTPANSAISLGNLANTNGAFHIPIVNPAQKRMVAADSNIAASLLLNTSFNVNIHLLKLSEKVSSVGLGMVGGLRSVVVVVVVRVEVVVGVPEMPIEAIGRADGEEVVAVEEIREAFCMILSRGSTIAAWPNKEINMPIIPITRICTI